MTYLVLKVYSFECDICGDICEVGPEASDARHAERILRKRDGWTVSPGATKYGGGHFCPAHPHGVIDAREKL